jgi:hypothetical protein
VANPDLGPIVIPSSSVIPNPIVIPAQAGIQSLHNWIPACAGMTKRCSRLWHSIFTMNL